MASNLKSRLERLEQQCRPASEPLIVEIARFNPFDEGEGIFVENQFYAKPVGVSLEELERGVINDLMRSGPRNLIVVEHYEPLDYGPSEGL